ncbi:MAG: hypothetical protein WDN26_17510 [Chitinophagaceae bacterium]
MKNFSFKTLAAVIIVLPVIFSACVKDTCKGFRTYTYYEPVYKTKDEVRANIKSNGPRPIENTGKLNILGDYIFLNEVDKGIHIINNSDPSNPKNFAFIDIPGNQDIAVKGNTLYADLYTDLVAIDISNPANVKVTKIVESLFPNRYYGNSIAGSSNTVVIADWIRKDTTVEQSCGDNGQNILWSTGRFLSASVSSGGSSSGSPIGIGGSMARFTIINNRLYTLNNKDLDVLNITNATDPQHSNRVNVGWNIETIYPFKNKLFIGSQNGMYIYSLLNPDAPSLAGQFAHVRSCDPVIADDQYAYVTLRSGNACLGFTNELDIIKLNDITNPSLAKVYQLKNPHGLSKDDDLLFICDGTDGVKVYNAANVMSLQQLKTIGSMDAYDVIAYNKKALVVAKKGCINMIILILPISNC